MVSSSALAHIDFEVAEDSLSISRPSASADIANDERARRGLLSAISSKSRKTAAVTVRSVGWPPVWGDWSVLASPVGFMGCGGSVATGVLWSSVSRLIAVNVSEVPTTEDRLPARLASLETTTTRLAFRRDEDAASGTPDFTAVNGWCPSLAEFLMFVAIAIACGLPLRHVCTLYARTPKTFSAEPKTQYLDGEHFPWSAAPFGVGGGDV